jgi:hypothetical protein
LHLSRSMSSPRRLVQSPYPDGWPEAQVHVCLLSWWSIWQPVVGFVRPRPLRLRA